jgi:NhaP-type Na+/H+ or K+/H+ antiporter
MERMRPGVQNAAINIINHRETNLIITCIILFISVYITLIALFDRNLIHPFGNISTDNETVITNVSAQYEISRETPYSHTIISLFFLWVCSIVVGRLAGYVYLPSLLGMLLVGMAFRNFGFLQGLLVINAEWENLIRTTAFILIFIRCAISLDPEALRNSLFVCTNLGIVSTTAEVAAIVLTSHFLYGVPVAISILFGYVLASTSPAVTVPTMITLAEKGRGVSKGIPTVVMSSSVVDNIYTIAAFTVASAVVFTTADDLSYTIVRIPVQLLIGALMGILAGLLLRSFPRPDAHLMHFTRAVLIFSISAAFFFGTQVIKSGVAGPLAVFTFCVVAAMRWKCDNHRMTRPEERGFKIVWNLVVMPLLFALIGLIFDFSMVSWRLFGQALAILFIGVLCRILVVFCVSLCTNLNIKEQCFMAFSLMPKATVQAALAPLLFQYCDNETNCQQHSQLLLQTCLWSILITAPVGQLILQWFGYFGLDKRMTSGQVDPFQATAAPSQAWGSPQPESTFLFSDKDNRLHLEVNNPTKSNNGTSAGKTNDDPPTFEEINHQAYKIFKEQRLATSEVNDNANKPKALTYEPTKF